MRYGQHGYRDAKCCQNCLFMEIRERNDLKMGRYCRKHEQRVTDTKVCDYYYGMEDDDWNGRGILIDMKKFDDEAKEQDKKLPF